MDAQKTRLLLVEDDPDLQTLMQEYYNPRGYEVTVTADPAEIIRQLECDANFKRNFDVILTDLMLPNGNGIDFIKRMKALSPSTPVLLITAHGSVDVAVDAIAAGAFDFVVKPIHFQQLTISLERALHFKKLEEENALLRSSVKGEWTLDGIVGKSPAIQKVIDIARRVAVSSANILITGESGTGKEVIARAIHRQSERRNEPFIALNCSAIPEHLLESELFGHAKGAFTGAQDKRLGLFEEANKGTLFLDEIGDLDLGLQAKLLRVLQERKIKRVGENTFRDVDVRIVAATHKNLANEVREHRFREDLYFRLNVIPIRIPPLRERPEDIIPLADYFLKKFASQSARTNLSLSKAALDYLLKRPWKGNVRELENTIERAVVLSPASEIQPDDLISFDTWAAVEDPNQAEAPAGALPAHASALDASAPLKTLEEVTLDYIEHVMERVGGVKEQAARILDIDRKTLYRRIQAIDARKAARGGEFDGLSDGRLKGSASVLRTDA